MKRTILSLAAFVCCSLGVFAQTDLVATLSHGSNLTTYNGIDALSEAYNAAAEGDVITLSPGTFNAVDIEKAITVRGAGMIPMASNGNVSTQISGTLTINVPSSTGDILTIEGIHALSSVSVNGDNYAPVKLLKSRFEGSVEGFGVSMNAFSCIFAQRLKAAGYRSSDFSYRNTTLNCMNCVINNATSSGYYQSGSTNVMAKIIAINSLVNLNETYIPYSVFTNCIISSDEERSGNNPLPETCEATNCIGINNWETPDLFNNVDKSTNTMIEGSGEEAYSTVFQTLKGMKSLPIVEDYMLTTNAAATYLGDDGKQVGIYGGPTPFNPLPNNPQIKKFVVDSSTEGGKLNVKINVE